MILKEWNKVGDYLNLKLLQHTTNRDDVVLMKTQINGPVKANKEASSGTTSCLLILDRRKGGESKHLPENKATLATDFAPVSKLLQCENANMKHMIIKL